MEILQRNEQPQKANLIAYKSDGLDIVIDTKDVELLFADLQKYNEQFSIGAMMGRALGNLLNIYEEVPERLENTPNIEDENSHQQTTAFFIVSKHKNTLNSLGLTLEPVGANAAMFVEGQSAESTQMRINLANGERFTNFLGAVNVHNLDHFDFKSNLNSLANILTLQITDHYNFANMVLTDEMYELFANIEIVIGNYKRLGMGEYVLKLEDYLEHGKTGDLREYILAERGGLFKEPGKNFGPADWQCDSTPEALRARWNGALQVLELAKANPKANDLFNKLHKHLLMCVNYALSDLSRLSYLGVERQNESLWVLVLAKTSLNEYDLSKPQTN